MAAMAEAGVGRIYYQHFASPDAALFEGDVRSAPGLSTAITRVRGPIPAR